MGDQVPHEAGAFGDLADFDELVGLVRLVDRAGPANHRGEARLLKLAGFRAVRNRRAPVRAR